jgi:hypothetical protein
LPEATAQETDPVQIVRAFLTALEELDITRALWWECCQPGFSSPCSSTSRHTSWALAQPSAFAARAWQSR